jgi:hypothetical protein
MVLRKNSILWSAVDQAGNEFDILVQRRRDKRAMKKFFRSPSSSLTRQISMLFSGISSRWALSSLESVVCSVRIFPLMGQTAYSAHLGPASPPAAWHGLLFPPLPPGEGGVRAAENLGERLRCLDRQTVS